MNSLTVTPSGVAGAYAKVQSGASGDAAGDATGGFGGALNRAIQGVVDSGRNADAQSMKAIAGDGNVTDVVMAVSKAELALQTATAIRDKVVQAYQDVMRMPI